MSWYGMERFLISSRNFTNSVIYNSRVHHIILSRDLVCFVVVFFCLSFVCLLCFDCVTSICHRQCHYYRYRYRDPFPCVYHISSEANANPFVQRSTFNVANQFNSIHISQRWSSSHSHIHTPTPTPHLICVK